jgi:hypothetical protein
MAHLDLVNTTTSDEDAERFFTGLLQNEVYVERIQNMLANEETRLSVNLDMMR